MSKTKVLLLGGDGASTRIVFHFLSAHFEVVRCIREQPVPRSQFLKNRAKKLGWPMVIGQVVFQAGIAPILKKLAAGRLAEIFRENSLRDMPVPDDKLLKVNSINDPATIETVRQTEVDVVVVNGTRILSKRLLAAVPAPILNTHAGITPLYRGVHGGYWALANGDRANCGVTVHLVDAGIDTGGILYQTHIEPTRRDNFATYPLLQLAAALPFLKRAVEDAAAGRLQTQPAPPGVSRLWYHPTTWQYLKSLIFRGIK